MENNDENKITLNNNQNENKNNMKIIKNKFQIDYNKILNIIRELKNEQKNILIQYYINICFTFSDIDILNKIEFYSILFSIYYNYDNKFNICINIKNKLNDISENYKNLDKKILIKLLYKLSTNLLSKNIYLYSLFYIQNSLKLTNKYDDYYKIISDFNINCLNSLNKYLSEYKTKFENKKINIEILQKMINILSQNFNNNNNDNENKTKYQYLINKKWVKNALDFLNKIIETYSNENEFKKVINDSFDFKNIYLTYFNFNKESKFAFPGEINNYEITSFKDNLEEKDRNFLSDNCYLKKNLKLNEDYLMLSKYDWDFLEKYFNCTNKLLRKKDDYNLKKIKCLILTEQFKENCENLKEKYIQISENFTLKDFKEKLLRNLNLEENNKNQNENNNKNSNKIKEEKNKIENKNNYKFYFNLLPLEYKNILYEIIIAYKNDIKKINTHIKSLKLENDDLKMKDFPYISHKKSNSILIIEITNKEPFLNKIENKCSNCNKNLDSFYECDECHLFQFCSKSCSNKNINHINISKILNKIFLKPFDLNSLFSTNLKDQIGEQNFNFNKFSLGRIGLKNLGNQCYMNAALQCLSNSEDLTKYFLLKIYKKEINLSNHLGSNGDLVESYYNLIYKLWFTKYDTKEDKENSYINPINFKYAIARKIEQFNNLSQQDSQEFISLFLDNLHEDINRIKKKQYFELKEKQKDEDDKIASIRWWNFHKKREDSIIVDLFHGQFKSEIFCPTCKKLNITYEPFMFLSMSIPSCESSNVKIKFFYKNLEYEFNFGLFENSRLYEIKNKCLRLDVCRNNNIKYLEAIVLNKDKLVKNKIIDDNELIFSILNKDFEICLYVKEEEKNENGCNIYFSPFELKIEQGYFSNKNIIDLYSYPISIFIKYNETLNDIFIKINARLNNFLKNNNNNINNNNIKYYIYHNTFKSLKDNAKELCKLCNNKKNENYCDILKRFSLNASFQTILKTINKSNINRILFFLIESKIFDITKKLYENMNLKVLKTIKNETLIKKNNNIKLYDVLDLFNKEEKLEEDNLWYCNKCKIHIAAIKKINIYKPPNYLIIHFKRFKIKSNNAFMSIFKNKKITTFIDYPIDNFDMRDYVLDEENKDSAIYELYGIIIHKGGLNGGHYFSYCKNNGKWFEYDDENINVLKENELKNKDAYVLFYKKKDLCNINNNNN